VKPHAAEQKFFYGANFEFSYNAKHWDPRTYSSEIRPIFGWHLKPWDIVINPIVDNSWYGGLKSLEFVPATRVAYNLNSKWAVAVEEYADYGQLRDIVPVGEQFHQIWGVFDHGAKYVHVEAGVGFGLTSASDKLTFETYALQGPELEEGASGSDRQAASVELKDCPSAMAASQRPMI
jgi:hypothetical protein